MKNKAKTSDFSPLNMDVLDSFLDGGGEQLGSDTSADVRWVPIAELSPAEWQPRRYFDPVKITELANSFINFGFKGTVNVRQKNDKKYEIIAGERRYRAAIEAGLESIPCVIAEYTDEQALEFSLIENLVREDLSKLEETEGVLDFLAIKLSKSRDEIIATIRVEGHPTSFNRGNVSPESNIGKINSILNQFGINLDTFRAKNLLLLKLPHDLKSSHLSGKLSYTKAIELNKIKDDTIRKELLEETLSEDLAISDIKKKVSDIRNSRNTTQDQELENFMIRLNMARKRIQKIDLTRDQNRLKRLNELVEEIEALC